MNAPHPSNQNSIAVEPSWITELRQQCQAIGRKKVAERIGFSVTVISQVLNQKYPGDIEKVERAVRGAYMGDTVMCPVMGELQTQKCISHQKTKVGEAVNPMRVQLYRACNSGQCPHSDKYKEQ